MAKMTAEDQEALAEHFRDKDLYDPSRAPEQETANFQPKPPIEDEEEQGLWSGGCTEGMAQGGEVGLAFGGDDFGLGPIPGLDSFSGPSVSGGTETAKAQEPGMDVPEGLKDVPIGAILAGVSGAVDLGRNIFGKKEAPEAPPATPTATPTPPVAPGPAGKLAPDQYDELIKFLKAKPSMGQSAMTDLAGLADAISTGVARAPSPGFQKNLLDTQQQQKKNLIDALREKYDVGFKRENLAAENMRAANAQAGESARTAATQAGENARAGVTSGLAAKKLATEAEKDALEQAQKGAGLWHAVGRKFGFGPPLPTESSQGVAPVVVKTTEEWAALPKGTHYTDAKGKPGVKK